MKKILFSILVTAILLSFAAPVFADTPDNLVGVLTSADSALTRVARRAYRLSARTCGKSFLQFTKGEISTLPASCTTKLQPRAIAVQFCAMNVKRDALKTPRGWTAAQMTDFCAWAIAE